MGKRLTPGDSPVKPGVRQSMGQEPAGVASMYSYAQLPPSSA